MKRFLVICLTLFLAIISTSQVEAATSPQIHYVRSLNRINKHYDGWYYNGYDWKYVKNKQFLVGPQVVNNIPYYFKQDGIQATPYKINYQYELTIKQGTNQRAKNNFIILHDIGGRNSGKGAAQLMKKTVNQKEAYTNFIVGDGGKVYQIKTPGTVAWGAGVYANENSPVQIELARTDNPFKFMKDYFTYVELTRDMAGKYNIPLSLDQGNKNTRGIKSHIWVTQHIWGTHKDPYEYLIRFGVTKNELANDLSGRY